jgi:hypothetical protein
MVSFINIAMKIVPKTVQSPKKRNRYPITKSLSRRGIAIAIARVVIQTMKVAMEAALSYKISAKYSHTMHPVENSKKQMKRSTQVI